MGSGANSKAPPSTESDESVDSPTGAQAEIQIENVGSEAASSGDWSFDFNIPQGEDRLLLVGSHAVTASYTTAAVTFGGDKLALAEYSEADSEDGEDCNSTLWFLVAPSEGTHPLTVQLNGTSSRSMAVWAMALSGVDQDAPIGDSSSTYSDFLANSTSVSLLSSSEQLVVDNICTGAPGQNQIAAGSQQVQVSLSDRENLVRIASSVRVGAAEVEVAWTHGAATNTLQALSLRPAR